MNKIAERILTKIAEGVIADVWDSLTSGKEPGIPLEEFISRNEALKLRQVAAVERARHRAAGR